MVPLPFGISSVRLGKAAAFVPEPDGKGEEWKDAVRIEEFYRAGGNPEPVAGTKCFLLWDEKALYVRFECADRNRVMREGGAMTEQALRDAEIILDQENDRIRKEKERAAKKRALCEEDESGEGILGMIRKANANRPPRPRQEILPWYGRTDRVELAVSSGSFERNDFSVFIIKNTGEIEAFREKGMTWLGGDKAYMGGAGRIENQAEITPIERSAYSGRVRLEEEAWIGCLAIPWELVGGKPEKSFRFLPYRIKHQNSEISTPYPQDMQINFSDRFEYDPLSFLEAQLGGEPGIEKGGDVLFSLPDGIQRWQRPAGLFWPDEEERTAIEALHFSKEKTDENNLAERVGVLQRWQDTLTLEGMDFFTGQSVALPWDFYEPWVTRRLCNEALAKGEKEEACRRIDEGIAAMGRLTEWWYADHTLGNRDLESWKGLGELCRVQREGNAVGLFFQGAREERRLRLTAEAGGFRFQTGREGFFGSEARPLWLEERKDGFCAEAECGSIRIKTGEDWEIWLEGSPFAITASSLLLREEDGLSGFELKLSLGEGDGIYGFGECFDRFDQRGKVRTLWQRDACEGCLASIGNQAYKNVALLHNTAGYSLFLNSHFRIRADVGCEEKDRLRINAAGDVVDFYVWNGTPQKVLDCYTQLTGRPILPPEWVFEPWAGGGAGRWIMGPLTDMVQEMKTVLTRFEELDIPHTGFYAEGAGASWIAPSNPGELYEIVNFSENLGIHSFSWQNPDMPEREAVRLLPGIPAQEQAISRAPAGEGNKELPSYIDFTHPGGMDLLRAQWKVRLDAGIRGTMVDFGDFVPEEALFYDGRTGKEMHNAYAYEYAKGYRQLFSERYGEDHVLYTRSAGPGSQQFACQFAGDHLTSFLGMKYVMNGASSVSVSGLPYYGPDATGYDGFADEETYLRWTEWAAFCPIMRYHGTQPREPWEYGPDAVEIYRKYAWLRENLLPYTYSLAVQAHRTGMPMVRPLILEYPNRAELLKEEGQYLFGRQLLVAPVFSEGTDREVYFPEGSWTSLWDNRDRRTGGLRAAVEAPIDRIPVYLREGAFLPLELNTNLAFGQSMTKTKAKVLLITPPDTGREEIWYRSETEEIPYRMEKNEDGFSFECQGNDGWEYVLVKGLPERAAGIEVNGETCPEKAERGALYFEAGWVSTEDHTAVIRLLKSSGLRIRVFLESGRNGG